MKTKCKWRKWRKLDYWTAYCANKNSYCYGEECIEQDKKEPQDCEDKEEIEE